jgi:hypothetical protein
MKTALPLLAVTFACAVALLPAAAADEKKPAPPKPPANTSGPAPSEALGSAESWSAYMYKQKGRRVCYLIGRPEKSAPANAKRTQPMAMVTHRPEEKSFNVVSFAEGYPLKEGSDATVEIGGRTYTLFTRDESAWTSTAEFDKELVEALSKGKTAVVTATSQKGTTTVDTYSLAGFSKALGMIDAACAVKR